LCEHYRKKRILKIDPRQDRFWVEGLSAAFWSEIDQKTAAH
jgi:hypothetical protein